MEFVRIAERQNAERAKRHSKHRKRDWIVALSCFGIVVSIYGYTIFAIKQVMLYIKTLTIITKKFDIF